MPPASINEHASTVAARLSTSTNCFRRTLALTGRRPCGVYRPIAPCVAPVERVVRRTSGEDDCSTIDLPTVYGSGPIAANIRRQDRTETDRSMRQRNGIPPSAANDIKRLKDRAFGYVPEAFELAAISGETCSRPVDRSIRLLGGSDRGLPAISGPRHRRRVTSPASEHQATNGGDMRAAGVDQPLRPKSPPPLRIIALFHHACRISTW